MILIVVKVLVRMLLITVEGLLLFIQYASRLFDCSTYRGCLQSVVSPPASTITRSHAARNRLKIELTHVEGAQVSSSDTVIKSGLHEGAKKTFFLFFSVCYIIHKRTITLLVLVINSPRKDAVRWHPGNVCNSPKSNYLNGIS